MRSSLLGLVISAGLVACASTPTPPVAATTLSSASAAPESCKGAQFDADDADPHCLRHHPSSDAAPSPSALKVTVHADSVAKSGHDAVLVVEMRNVSPAPLALDVDSACAWDVTATDGVHNSFESDCGGICGRGEEPSVLHVTLDPDGVVVKRVHFYAVQKRVITNAHEQCEEHSAGGLPPGRYTVSVALPWSEPSKEHPGSLVARTVDVPVTVTP